MFAVLKKEMLSASARCILTDDQMMTIKYPNEWNAHKLVYIAGRRHGHGITGYYNAGKYTDHKRATGNHPTGKVYKSFTS